MQVVLISAVGCNSTSRHLSYRLHTLLLAYFLSGGLENIFSKSTMRPLEQAQQLADVHGFVYDALGIRFSYWRDKALTVKEIEYVTA